MTPELYLATCKRRFGTANPERVDMPAWEWMVRNGHNPYMAREELGLEPDYGVGSQPGSNPDWCFDRMGTASVELADGRELWIAGEYEDWYHPDFCIYNDLVVKHGDDVQIYAYPREVFPPTDFHTATLIGETIWIIGSLGYHKERGGPDTQVFAMDTTTYRLRRVAHQGPSPGWLHKHRASLQADGATIHIQGGQTIAYREDKQHWRTNNDVYAFDPASGTWSKLTDHSDWRELRINYEENAETLQHTYGWITGKILKKLPARGRRRTPRSRQAIGRTPST